MNLYKRNKTWWVSYTAKGVHYRKSLKTQSESIARSKVLDLERAILGVELGAVPIQSLATQGTEPTVAEVTDQYIRFLTDTGAPQATITALRQARATIDRGLEASPRGIAQWIAKQGKVKGQTINQRRSLLRRAWHWGEEHGVCWSRNPWDLVPHQRVDSPIKPEDLTDDEVSRLLAASEGERKLHWMFYAFTGVRAEVGMIVEWSWLDLAHGWLDVPAQCQKRNKAGRIPLHPALREALISWFPDCPHKPYVFRQMKSGRCGIWRQLQADLKVAGITKHTNIRGLRHTFATRALAAGQDLLTVSALLGHANVSTTQEYLHIKDHDLQRVIGALAAPSTNQTQPAKALG
jgi:integrase